MIKIKKYIDTQDYEISIGVRPKQLEKLITICTVSTNDTLRIFRDGFISIDCLAGLKYIDQAYEKKNIDILKKYENFLVINFTDDAQDTFLDNLDLNIEDQSYNHLIKIFINNYDTVAIHIDMRLILFTDPSDLKIIYE